MIRILVNKSTIKWKELLLGSLQHEVTVTNIHLDEKRWLMAYMNKVGFSFTPWRSLHQKAIKTRYFQKVKLNTFKQRNPSASESEGVTHQHFTPIIEVIEGLVNTAVCEEMKL